MATSSNLTIHSACRMCHGVHQVLVQLEGDGRTQVIAEGGDYCDFRYYDTETLLPNQTNSSPD